MKTSTKHHIGQLVIGAVALAIFLGPIWQIPYLENVPAWLMMISWVIGAFVIVSGFGVGPWGRALNRACAAEDVIYRNSLEPKQPWQSKG